jgi:hypothetical protein
VILTTTLFVLGPHPAVGVVLVAIGLTLALVDWAA